MKIKICLAAILLFLCSMQIVFAQKKFIKGRIVNGKAIKLPKPDYPQEAKDFCIIESWTGKVLRARAISGHPLLRVACEASARKAKFAQTNDVPNNPIKASLIYKFKPDGTIDF